MSTTFIDHILAARWLDAAPDPDEAAAREAYDALEALTDEEFRELSTEDLIKLSVPFQRYCEDCTRSFEACDPDERLCPDCQRHYRAEHCPEACAEWDEPELPALDEDTFTMALRHTYSR